MKCEIKAHGRFDLAEITERVVAVGMPTCSVGKKGLRLSERCPHING